LTAFETESKTANNEISLKNEVEATPHENHAVKEEANKVVEEATVKSEVEGKI